MIINVLHKQIQKGHAYNLEDTREVISSGRSLDYAENIYLTTGNILYSNRSNPMLTIAKDEVGKHDFTLTPCSKDTFRILYNDDNPHHGCQGNFEKVLSETVRSIDELPNGYTIAFPMSAENYTLFAEFVTYESRCCPFLSFALKADSGVELATLDITGPDELAKQYIAAELGLG